MAFFDLPKLDYPKRWSEYSLDYKIFFVWEGALMAAIIAASSKIFVTLNQFVFFSFPAALALALLGISLSNRNRRNWRWPRPDGAVIAKAMGVSVLMGVFLFVFATPMLPLTRSSMPMLAFAVSIGIFNVLTALRLVQISQKDFDARCTGEPETSTPRKPIDPLWKRAVRAAFSVLFLLVWLEGMGAFYFHDKLVRSGSRHPTTAQSQVIDEHGSLIYVTADQKRFDDFMLATMMVGIPAILASGFFLHFVLGIAMFPNLPPSNGFFRFGK